jgi:AhpD family alkylhydroperoxidase
VYDIKDLGKLKALDANAPEAMKAFGAFDKAAMAAGSIPSKYKELIALAIAFTTQCPYCIDIHANRAREADATEQELSRSLPPPRFGPGRRLPTAPTPWHNQRCLPLNAVALRKYQLLNVQEK